MRDRDFITETPTAADLRRFWCPYTDLEEYHAGMWRRVEDGRGAINQVAAAVALLKNPMRFRDAVDRVLREWPTSCRAEFTSPGNHLAWLGQAACCLVDGVPEALTRRAWWKLTGPERVTADTIAHLAVLRWTASNTLTAQLDLFSGSERHAQAIS